MPADKHTVEVASIALYEMSVEHPMTWAMVESVDQDFWRGVARNALRLHVREFGPNPEPGVSDA